MDEKTYYIEQISNASDKFGDKLLLLMDKYHKNNLREITEQEVKEFYEMYIKESR